MAAQQKTLVIAFVASCSVTFIAGGIVGTVAGLMIGRSHDKAPAPLAVKSDSDTAAKPPPGRKLLTREELESLVREKTRDEVLAILGKPLRTNRWNDGESENWFYEWISYDALTGKADREVRLQFHLYDGGRWSCDYVKY